MSKISLKKELSLMTKEQLEAIVLDAYSANKEIRDYFEYFLNPNPKEKSDKLLLDIYKELNRSKRGYSKGRISVVRKIIKKFISYQPDSTYIISFYISVIAMILNVEDSMFISNTLSNGTKKIIYELIEYSSKNGNTTLSIEQLNKLLTPTDNQSSFINELREYVKIAIAEISSIYHR